MAIKRFRLLFNIASNYLSVGISLLIGVFLAPFLIKKLGIELYGIIALANTFPSYIQIFTNGLSNSSTKFISMSLENDELHDANIYFNTSFKIITILIIGLFPLAVLISILTPTIFNIPLNSEKDSTILVFLVLISTFFNIIQAPLISIHQVHHKFIEQNVILIISKLSAISVLLLLFKLYAPNVWFVGIYQIVITLFSAILFYNNYNKFQNTFEIRKISYNRDVVKKIGKLGFWNSVNDVAFLFFMMISQIFINKFLGVKASGLFGPVLILVSLLLIASGAISNVMMPIIYKDIATMSNKNSQQKKLFFICKSLSYIVGIPLVTLTVFTNELLFLWLGDGFQSIVWVVRIFLVSFFLGGIIFLPLSHYFRGSDKIKIPAIINLLSGIANILFILILFHLNFGLMGVAISFSVTYGLTGFLFNIYYYSKLEGISILVMLRKIIVIIFILLILILLSNFILNSSISLMQKLLISLITNIIFVMLLGFSKGDYLYIKNIMKK